MLLQLGSPHSLQVRERVLLWVAAGDFAEDIAQSYGKKPSHATSYELVMHYCATGHVLLKEGRTCLMHQVRTDVGSMLYGPVLV